MDKETEPSSVDRIVMETLGGLIGTVDEPGMNVSNSDESNKVEVDKENETQNVENEIQHVENEIQHVENEQPTFATTSEDIDVHIHNSNLLILNPELIKKENNTNEKEESNEEKERREFYRMLLGSNSTPTSRLSNNNCTKKSASIPRPPSENLSENEINAIVENLLKGKKYPNLNNPGTVAKVVKELDSRRIDALNKNEYLKSKKIGDIIEAVKNQMYQADRDLMFKENIETLKQRHQEALDAYEGAKAEWKKRHVDFVEKCKKEASDLQAKHDNDMADLGAKWTDPSMLRKFTKRSPYLLQQKAVEKYMVLAGNLEGAEETKKINQQNERAEAQRKFLNMQESYESSRKQLIESQNEEINQMKIQQEVRYRQMLVNEQDALELCRKRIVTAQRNLDEQSDVDKYLAKKFKKAPGTVLPLSAINTFEDLPALSRGKGYAKGDVGRHVTPKPEPLQLPPLKVRQSKQTKIVINFK